MNSHSFLKLVHGQAEGYFCIWDRQTKQARFFHTSKIEQAARYIEQHKGSRDLYFSTGLFSQPLAKGRGSSADVSIVTCISGDIDTAEGEHAASNLPATVEEALSLFGGLPEPSLILHTGGGLHYHYLLEEPTTDTEQAHKLRRAVQKQISTTAQQKGWVVDSTADLARVLRIAGTYNHKGKQPKAVRLLSSTSNKYPLSAFAQYLPLLEQQAKKQGQGKRQGQGPALLDKEQVQEMLSYIPKQLEYKDWLGVLYIRVYAQLAFAVCQRCVWVFTSPQTVRIMDV